MQFETVELVLRFTSLFRGCIVLIIFSSMRELLGTLSVLYVLQRLHFLFPDLTPFLLGLSKGSSTGNRHS